MHLDHQPTGDGQGAAVRAELHAHPARPQSGLLVSPFIGWDEDFICPLSVHLPPYSNLFNFSHTDTRIIQLYISFFNEQLLLFLSF